MLEELEMCMRWLSKGQGLDGKPCLETGAKTGRAILTSMVRPFPSWSPPVMVTLSSLTTLPRLPGPSVRPIPDVNFDTELISH